MVHDAVIEFILFFKFWTVQNLLWGDELYESYFSIDEKSQSSLKLEKKDRCIIHDKRDQLHNISRNSANAAYSVQCNMIIVDKYYYGTWIILSGIRAQDDEIENPVP